MTTTATVISDTPQADGRRSITIRYQSVFGDDVTDCFICPADYDLQNSISNRVLNLEDSWRQTEVSSMADIVAAGSVPIDQIIAGFKWMTVADAVTEAIRWGVESSDPVSLANMEDVFNYIQINFTDAQITQLTGIQQDKIDLYRLRIGKVLGTGRVKDELTAIEQTKGSLNG